MNEFKYKYRCALLMNLRCPEEITTSQLYGVQMARLVEMFLVEVYRCKLCQFTSSIKSKIRTHLAYTYEMDTAHQISGCPEMG